MKYIYDKITPEMEPLKVAVVHPVDENSLRGAFEAAAAKLIVPILVGPEQKIRKAAADANIDISGFEIVPTEHSHASAEAAVKLVKDGKAEALMKGKISTDEFLTPVVAKENGLRTDRRMSHVFIMQDPDYHKPLYITDAAMNIAPDLAAKKDIIQNAIDLFWTIEGREPKVAILAATEKVEEKQQATLDAAALTVMALRGQITGAKVEGPFAFDNAISKKSAKLKDIFSDVAGDADILVFPDMASGNIYFKSRTFLSSAPLGGIVVGARTPIILNSRSAEAEERKASAAIALVNARNPNRPKP
ncbi:MAG: bifunctional enoyl-CoA hydratase/phosphate acetyltransferase [Micavibrio sp.]|nr:bifunctional enoyl-CoA hydratase/phosphate acetyltransferase [Micavibrio sp.]